MNILTTWNLLKSLFILLLLSSFVNATTGIVVFQSDFGTQDGAVSEVKGVIYSVDRSLIVSDLTNEIIPFNIWEASYRLYQTAPYWPQKTVFVSVVDPGVGTDRDSVVALSKNGYFFVTPDNGTLTFIDDMYGLKEVRVIDERKNRLKGSNASYTFHGRDVYAYTAAKLASGKISFEEVGPKLKKSVVKLPYQKATIKDHMMYGTIMTLDPNYGNVWTNIDKKLMSQYGIKENELYRVTIYRNKVKHYSGTIKWRNTFGDTPKGSDLLYNNSLLRLSLAINQGSFAQKYNISAGPEWTITVEK